MKRKGKLILIDIEGSDEGAVAAIVAEVAKLANVNAVEVFDSGEVRVSRACPVFSIHDFVNERRGEIPGGHVEETCPGGRVAEEVR